MRRNISMIASMLFGTAMVLAAGLNGFFWTSTTSGWRVPIRILLLILGVVIVSRAALKWGQVHGDTLARTLRRTGEDRFLPYAGQDLRLALEQAYASLPALTAPQLLALVPLIVAPTHYRERVEETQTIAGPTTQVATRVVLDGVSHETVALTRQLKSTSYGALHVETGSGESLHPLSFVSSLGLSYAVANACIASHMMAMTPDARHNAQNKIAQIIADPADTSIQVSELGTLLASTALWTDPALRADKAAFIAFMSVVAERRITYVRLPSPQSTVELTYTYTVPHPPAKTSLPQGADKWRALKDAARERLHFTSKFVAISLARSRSVDSYKLHVKLPDGLYIDEANVYADGRVVESLDRYVVSRSHVSHSALNGRPDLRVSAWRMQQVPWFKDPVILIRLSESPPGSVFTASLVAMGVVVTVWLTGVLSGSSLRQLEEAGPADIDMAALAVTLPGLLVAWLGLSAPAASHGYRSLTALGSLLFSALLAVATAAVYIGRFAIDRLPEALFPAGKSLFFLQDWASTGLFLFAMLNFGIVAGLLLARLHRYSSLRRL